MKKALLIVALVAFGGVTSSQAVVIHWAATTSGITYNSAQLVYVSDGVEPTYEEIAGLPTVGTAASGGGLAGSAPTPSGVYERTATDNDARSGVGAYFVVLFNAGSAVAVSQNSLAWDSTGGEITESMLDPATGVFIAGLPNGTLGAGNGWTPIPEPSTWALLAVGAAAIAWRRRKRG